MLCLSAVLIATAVNTNCYRVIFSLRTSVTKQNRGDTKEDHFVEALNIAKMQRGIERRIPRYT